MPRTTILILALLFTSMATLAPAAQYSGWSETGWVWGSKRECCNAAIALAYQDAIDRCYQAGGRPSVFAGSRVRGSCSAEWSQDPSGYVVYNCESESSVACQ